MSRFETFIATTLFLFMFVFSATAIVLIILGTFISAFLCLLGCAICFFLGIHFFGETEEPRSENSSSLTATGETFEMRASYHRRGELSPGEHAIARAIRESLKGD